MSQDKYIQLPTGAFQQVHTIESCQNPLRHETGRRPDAPYLRDDGAAYCRVCLVSLLEWSVDRVHSIRYLGTPPDNTPAPLAPDRCERHHCRGPGPAVLKVDGERLCWHCVESELASGPRKIEALERVVHEDYWGQPEKASS